MLKLLGSFFSFIKSLFFGKELIIPKDVDRSPLKVVPDKIDVSARLPPQDTTPLPMGQTFVVHNSPPYRDMRADTPAAGVTPVVPIPALSPLFFDTYQGDYTQPDLSKLSSDPLYYGVILKATEGNYYAPSWLLEYWNKARLVGGDRYGKTWFRGAFHYLKFNLDGKLQADYFLNAISKAGGWARGDLWPIIDCELGNDGSQGVRRDTNQDASRQQIMDCVVSCATRLKEVLGRQVMLYGGDAMYERSIVSRMNCDWLWFPRYTETLPMVTYTRIGWPLDKLWGWQYSGDSASFLKGYPATSPLGKHGDITAMVMSGGIEKLPSLLFVKP